MTTLEADIDPENPNRILLVSTLAQREMIKTVPGALWDRTRNRWHVPLAWTTCLALRATFGDDLVIGPGLNAWALAERTARIDPALGVRELLDAPGDSDLYPHQRADVQFLVAAQQAILGNDPGVGKTASAIRAAVALWRAGESPFPALIVTPNTVKRTWVREFNKWWPGLTVTVVGGTAAQRRKQLATPSHVWILNWESLRAHSRLAPYGSVSLKRCVECGGEDSEVTVTRCETHIRELNEMDFNLVIADEAHRAKDPKAKATRALWAATGDAKYRFGLTGTPIANDATELWPLLHWLSPQEWPSKTRWLDRFCTPPDAPILMADGTFKPIGDIVVGDRVVGFDKTTSRLTYENAEVLATTRRVAEIVKVTMESGATLYCTPDHKWLDARRHLVNEGQRGAHGVGASEWNSDPANWGRCSCGYTSNAGNFAKHVRRHPTHSVAVSPKKKPREQRWQTVTSSDRVTQMTFVTAHAGNRLSRVVDVPEPLSAEQERAALWLGGLWDGEGSVKTLSQSVSHNPEICQRIRDVLTILDIPYTEKRRINKVSYGTSETATFTITGGRSGWTRLMHYCRPEKRFLIRDGKYAVTRHPLFSSGLLWGSGARVSDAPGRGRNQATAGDKIVSVESAGVSEVVALQTTSGTYIVYGYASANCDIMYNAFGGVVVSGIKPERETEFFTGFHPRFRRVIKSTVLKDLPPIVSERRDVEMSPKQAKAYIQMRDELLAEVDGGLLMAPTVLTRTMRLLQLTSSYGELEADPVDPDKPRFLLGDPSSKLDQFMDDIPDFGDQSVVVFAVSRQLINLLSARMTKAKIPHGLITGDQTEWERDKAITDFQEGRIRFVLCTIAAGGVGITLSRGSVMAFLQRSWSLVEMTQAENRCQRPGSEIHDSILRVDYVVPGTVEEAVIATLNGKGEKFEDIVRDREAIRRMLLGGEE